MSVGYRSPLVAQVVGKSVSVQMGYSIAEGGITLLE